METDGVKLLPCPFCGEAAVLHDYQWPNGKLYPAYVGCSECDCALEPTFDQSAKEAIAAWNRRALPTKAGEAVPVGWMVSGNGVESTLWFSESSASAVARNHGQSVTPLYAHPEAYGVRAAVIEECARVAVFAIRDSAVMVPSGPLMDERLPSRPALCTIVRAAIRALSHTEQGEKP